MTTPTQADQADGQAGTPLNSAQQRELLAQLLRAKAARSRSYPMSAGQQGLWHAFRRDPHSTAFNVFLPARIRAAINVDALRNSIEMIAHRHPCLRTTFSDRDGQLTQHLREDLKPEITVREILGANDDQAREVITGETLRPFDLERGPLLRVLVYKLAADDWIILASTHHIVVDFWSLIIILNELRQIYPSFTHGHPPRLPPPQANYAQFVRQQQQLLSSPRGKQLQAHWRSAMGDAASVVELPTDAVRPSIFTGRAASAPLEFPTQTAARIAEFAAQHTVTSVAVLQAAVQVFISRYSGQQSFHIGCPFSGRSHREYEQTVGFFVNMLPLKADLEGDPTFSQVVRRAARTLLDALQHEAYPIAHIVQDARIPRDTSRSPLFQVSCTFEKSQLKAEAGRAAFLFPGVRQICDFAGLQQESFYVPHQTCHYDLEFIFEQTHDQLRGMICYCRDLFDISTVDQMARNFADLLQSLLTHASTPVSRVPWQSVHDGERPSRPFVRPGDGDSLPASRDKFEQLANPAIGTVSGMIQAAAHHNPHGVALQFDGRQIRYAELIERAGGIARSLRPVNSAARGATAAGLQTPPGRNDIVPVCTSSGPNAVLAMLGVHLSGAAAVPIDLTQPAIDAQSLLQDTDAGVMLCEQPHPWLQNVGNVRLVNVDDACRAEPDNPSGDSPGLIFAAPHVGDMAYVVYTSGSTGKPKGVIVDHAAVCNTLAWRMRDVTLRPNDRVLMLLSHQFDAGLGIAWTTLTQRATLVWADRSARGDADALIAQILRDQITVLPAVPSLLKILASHPRFAECQSLRLIFTGGEPMPAELPSVIRAVSRAQFWNFYGPTEAAIEATAMQVTDHDAGRPVRIGKPIANTDVLVLDEYHRPVPDTVPGELAIAGAGLARGYLNQPELTTQRFVPNPGDASLSSRIYLTGDRGRKLPSGELEFLGRIDNQIKLRGYRIELGEIESILESHPTVDRAAVKLSNAGTPQAQLIAFVSLAHRHSEDQTLTYTAENTSRTAEIRRFAAEKLAAYKVPAAIVAVEHMPLTSSGKVNRRLLPDTVPADLLQTHSVAPTTELEKYLAAAWGKTLGVSDVGVNFNFFDAGGSSLQAAMLTSQLSQELGVHVPTALLFDLFDISRLATRLVELHPAAMAERFGDDCLQAHRQAARAASDSTSGQWPDHPLIAPLKPSGTRQPLFMVHPPGGIVACYRELAQRLPADQPLLAIRARGLHGSEQLPDSLQAMAADYVTVLQCVQPSGPYLLGGWSLGGLVAYEMAQQLMQAGQSVSQLVLLDTTIPAGSTELVPASELVNVGLEYGIELTLDQLGELAPEEQLPFLWEHAKKLGVLDDQSPPELVASVLRDLQSLFHHHVELSRGYRIQPFFGRITLFRPSQVPFALQISEDRGWRHLSRDVQVHFVPGHHHSMVQPPHVEHLARAIFDILEG